jgi:hypothetical protein
MDAAPLLVTDLLADLLADTFLAGRRRPFSDRLAGPGERVHVLRTHVRYAARGSAGGVVTPSP